MITGVCESSGSKCTCEKNEGLHHDECLKMTERLRDRFAGGETFCAG